MCDSDIDIGLAALVEIAEPGQTLSDNEIAEVCGVHRRKINEIGRRAIEKIRNEHLHKFDDTLVYASRQHPLS